MIAHTAGVGVAVVFGGAGSFLPLCHAWRGVGVRLLSNIAFSGPKKGVLQGVTPPFILIFNENTTNRSIAGGVGVVVPGGKTGFLYFFTQNAEFLAFYFHCYTVTKVVRHSVSKGFGCNSPSKLLQSVTYCYKIFCNSDVTVYILLLQIIIQYGKGFQSLFS